jgi:hypothetical protein
MINLSLLFVRTQFYFFMILDWIHKIFQNVSTKFQFVDKGTKKQVFLAKKTKFIWVLNITLTIFFYIFNLNQDFLNIFSLVDAWVK